MKSFITTIQGISPVIINRMKKELMDEMKKLKSNEIGEWEEKNWSRKTEFDDNGNVVIPTSWIRACLYNSSIRSGLIPSYATTKRARFTDLMSLLMIDNVGNGIKLENLFPYGCFLSAQGSRKTGGKVWRIRPMLKADWEATFKIVDPIGRMKIEELKDLLEYGGTFIGLGDSRKEGYGRFEVKSIEEIK